MAKAAPIPPNRAAAPIAPVAKALAAPVDELRAPVVALFWASFVAVGVAWPEVKGTLEALVVTPTKAWEVLDFEEAVMEEL